MQLIDREHVKSVYEKSLLAKKKGITRNEIQLQYILKHCPPGARQILDAGCGNGRFAAQLSERLDAEVHAVDLFDYIDDEGKFNYLQASIDQLPLDSDYFDFIYSNSVIYYLHDPETGIREFRRVMKKGGVVIISAHTKYSLFTLDRIIKRYFGAKGGSHLQGVKFYSARQYVNMFRRNGFEVKLVDGFRLSYFLYPFYRRVARKLKSTLRIALPTFPDRITGSRLMAGIKSIFGYHLIIVAVKG